MRQAIGETADESSRTAGFVIWKAKQILAGVGYEGPVPSDRTFCRLFGKLAHGRHATGSAPTRRSLAGRPEGMFGSLPAAAPGEVVQVGSTPLDVLVLLGDRVPGRVLDRTRSRLGIPAIRTIFGLATRPHRNRKAGPPAQEIVIERPRYGLSWFRITFGRLQVKACTKGEHVLRFEATVHNAKELRCRRGLDNFGQIITVLAGIADRFATALDCADTGFLPDGILDELPLPARAGTVRIAGIDLNKPRIRAALAAALALAPAPAGFTAAEHAARVRQITGHDGYTTRQAAYDLRKLRGKQLIDKPGRGRRYHVPPDGARIISALLTLRDHVIAPILAGVRSPRTGRKPKTWTAVDRDYENLRIGMQTLFQHVGIETRPAAA